MFLWLLLEEICYGGGGRSPVVCGLVSIMGTSSVRKGFWRSYGSSSVALVL